MIIDTDVLIWFLRGNEKAKEVVISSMPVSISSVTYMELIQGMRDKTELNYMKKAFGDMGINIIPINESISNYAVSLVEEYSLSHSMEMADALIASTCIKENEVLCTANDKHYQMINEITMDIFRP